eukprot:680156-Amphidinium_carterae.1
MDNQSLGGCHSVHALLIICCCAYIVCNALEDEAARLAAEFQLECDGNKPEATREETTPYPKTGQRGRPR